MIPQLLQRHGSVTITIQGFEIATDPGDASGFASIQTSVAITVGLAETVLEAWAAGRGPLGTKILKQEIGTIVLALQPPAQATASLHFRCIQSTITIDIQTDEQRLHPGAVNTHGLVARSGLQRQWTQQHCQRQKHADGGQRSHLTSLWKLTSSDDDSGMTDT